MNPRFWLLILVHAQKWTRSFHAKLFVGVGLMTSLITLLVAYAIIDNSRKEMLDYTKQLGIQTAQVVETEIRERDDAFLDPPRIKEFLERLAGTDRSIDEIDVFRVDPRSGKSRPPRVSLVTSSTEDRDVAWTPDLGRYLDSPNRELTAHLVHLLPGETNARPADQPSLGWEIYLPISSPNSKHAPIGLVRVYCDMERWEVVWQNNLKRTYRILPFVLLGEFILLWAVLSWLLNRPLRKITNAMTRLECGDASARAEVSQRDELGRIAGRFNLMAAELQRASIEREALIAEIQGLNSGLQTRIDSALSELQSKNRELERLLERISRLREELSQQERLAVAGQLTAAFAHEVGTPLNLVNGHLQLLLSQADLPERTRERLGTIQTQIRRVGDIVRQLLANTRGPEHRPRPVLFSELIADLQKLWGPTLASHRIQFQCSAPEDCLLLVDRKQMEQLFLNLVNNAVDALPEGGLIQLRIVREPDSADGKPRFAVTFEDNGAGIPEDVLPKVFRPLFTTKQEGHGTGLGLSICREIVRAHGSELRIQSQEDRGTTLHFHLPGA